MVCLWAARKAGVVVGTCCDWGGPAALSRPGLVLRGSQAAMGAAGVCWSCCLEGSATDERTPGAAACFWAWAAWWALCGWGVPAAFTGPELGPSGADSEVGPDVWRPCLGERQGHQDLVSRSRAVRQRLSSGPFPAYEGELRYGP
ncbi:hypothetical protein NDU88_006253 [Pleurodeles waltl]|uniref:Uncharacterized protein n=1 Tax=Pleurodeles waltl TaxID=8319 RepID=A0AAV7N6P7_PLEWA|nr:hypothetical protein NDU88_006253 [Pleurodeles waltl]